MPMSPKAFMIVACLQLAALPAAAVDGEILIDQAAVNAGGITPDDTAGFPATLSKAGRYKLTGNLTVPEGKNGIEATAQDVTVDLNGYTIRSAVPLEALSGVVAQSVGGLRVMNGTITGFKNWGVYVSLRRGAVEDMRILSGGDGVYLPAEGVVRSSTIANNSLTGVKCLATCFVEESVLTGNGSGIEVHNGAGLVLGNVIAGNGVQGIGALGPSTGYGGNILVGNNGGFGQVSGNVVQLHPNACEPVCP
jgi:hypothetical protein